MKVAVIGATGTVGSRLTDELIARGHDVTGIVRRPDQAKQRAGLTLVQGDVTDPAALAKLVAGHGAVIHSVKFVNTDARKVVDAVKRAGVKRLLVVGGAGSLAVAPGLDLVDAPGFPAEYKVEALAGREFLNTLRGELALEWTFVSPSAFFAPGERTGHFRLGTDELLTGADGQSRISTEDYAIAFVDELEQPRHTRARFTVGY
jgi:putative NADH-flavin reductase